MFFRQLATKEAALSYFFGRGGKGYGIAVDVGPRPRGSSSPSIRI